MKCEKCKLEWQSTGVEQVLFCPFCNSSLVILEENFQYLEDVFSYLTKEYGLEILRNKRSTLQFMKCFFPDGKREYRFTNMFYSSGYMDTIFRIRNLSEAVQDGAIKQVITQFGSRFGISMEWADYIVGCICKSLGMVNNVEYSIIKIRQLAEQGSSIFQFKLAECYRTGKKVQKNVQKYFNWLECSAKNGYPIAMFQLGEELWNGSVCERNINEAIRLIKKAAKFSNRDAVCFVAGHEEIYNCCGFNLDPYIQKILNSKGELSVKQLLGVIRYFVRQKDFAMAICLAKIAYEKDEKMAWETYVEVLHLDNSRESRALSLKVIKEVAISGNVLACKMLAEHCEDQAKTEQDMITALYWYRMAAEVGDVDAQIRLAQIYECGIVVQKDIEQAIFWYKMAAYNGDQYAKSKSIDFSCGVRDNSNWLWGLRDYYVKSNPAGYDDYWKKLTAFHYQIDDEKCLYHKMEHALKETERILLPLLDRVSDLDVCIEFLRVYNSTSLNVQEYDENYRFGYDDDNEDDNESLLYIQTDNHDDLVLKYNEMLDVTAKAIENGKPGYGPYEVEKKAYEEWRVETITRRDSIYNTPALCKKVLAELERRKKVNMETLRSYGVDL